MSAVLAVLMMLIMPVSEALKKDPPKEPEIEVVDEAPRPVPPPVQKKSVPHRK